MAAGVKKRFSREEYRKIREETNTLFQELTEENKSVCLKFCFECNEFIYEKILSRRGLLKLGAMCCQADLINYGNLPYTDFIRTQTLCRGGELCNFRFVRHETDAGDGGEKEAGADSASEAGRQGVKSLYTDSSDPPV